ncbi:putative target of rapamycin (TOR) kinase 1 [Trypanosoma cruzi]|nr:putative target of rapamycin (TOR) kinase 1 [Trypanosoma cruzi]
MEVMASRFLNAAAILCTRLYDHYFFSKAVRRRLSALNQGIVLETSPANLPPSAIALGERLRRIIENNRRRIIKRTEKASAAIIADASLQGWGAVFIPDFGDVKIAGGKWERKPFLIMQAEARAVRLALSAFIAVLPSTMDVWVDNASLQGAANKGRSKLHALTWERRRARNDLSPLFAWVKVHGSSKWTAILQHSRCNRPQPALKGAEADNQVGGEAPTGAGASSLYWPLKNYEKE